MQKATVNHANNPDVNNYLTSLENGEEGEMVLKFRKISTEGGVSELNIGKVIFQYEDEETETEPTPEEPLNIAMVETSELEDLSSEAGDALLEELDEEQGLID